MLLTASIIKFNSQISFMAFCNNNNNKPLWYFMYYLDEKHFNDEKFIMPALFSGIYSLISMNIFVLS